MTTNVPTLPKKVVSLARALEESELPYAFGGALALAYYAEPRATVDIDVFRQAVTHYDDAAGRTRLVGWGDDLTARMIRDFVDAILAGRPVPIDGEAGVRALEVAIAAYRSADLRRPVEISELRA